MSLTKRQTEVLRFITDFQRERGMPPTRHEIAGHFGWKSDNAAEDHIKALRKKGALSTKPLISRGIFIAGA